MGAKAFRLSSCQLLYRDEPDDVEMLAINLDGIICVRPSIKQTRCIELHWYYSTDTDANGEIVYLRAPNHVEYTRWMRLITDQIFHHNLETSKVTGDPELMRIPADVRATHLTSTTLSLLRLQTEAFCAPWQILIQIGEKSIKETFSSRTCAGYMTWLHAQSEEDRPRLTTRYYFELCENGELLRSYEQGVVSFRPPTMTLFGFAQRTECALC